MPVNVWSAPGFPVLPPPLPPAGGSPSPLIRNSGAPLDDMARCGRSLARNDTEVPSS